MRFTQYPTKRDQVKGENGRQRAGQRLSAAPGGIWIIPLERETGDPAALYGHAGRAGVYVIETVKAGP